MTANPNQHWGGENHTGVSRFVTRIVASTNSLELTDLLHDISAVGNRN